VEHGFDRLWEWSRQDDRTEAVAPANAATSPAFELEDRRGADVRVEHVLWTVRECPEVDLHREKLIAQETVARAWKHLVNAESPHKSSEQFESEPHPRWSGGVEWGPLGVREAVRTDDDLAMTTVSQVRSSTRAPREPRAIPVVFAGSEERLTRAVDSNHARTETGASGR
jgi:hypothetical protein